MNAINAFIFVIIGLAMGILPILFPSWFPLTGADQANARVLWLDLMATFQVGMGFAYIVWDRVLPLGSRLLAAIRASDTGGVVLAKSRGIPGR